MPDKVAVFFTAGSGLYSVMCLTVSAGGSNVAL